MNNPRKKLKIKLSETLLQELSTRKNDRTYNSRSATVYLGNNWVKKIAQGHEFSEADIFQYQIMEKHTDIFPTTKIKKTSNGVVILQKKVDVNYAEKIFYWVADQFNCEGHYCGLRDFLEDIVKEGLVGINKFIYDQNHKKFKRIEIGKWFEQFIEMCVKLHNILKQTPFEKPHHIDLHGENFGVENGNLKFIDFMTYAE